MGISLLPTDLKQTRWYSSKIFICPNKVLNWPNTVVKGCAIRIVTYATFDPIFETFYILANFIPHSRPQLESFSFVCLLSPHCLLFLPAPIYVDLPHLPASLPGLSPTDSFAPIPLPFFLTPNSASRPPFALAPCLYFWVAVFPLPRKRPPPKSSLFTSLFPSFYPSLLFLTHSPRPNSLSPSPLRTLSICYGYCKL